MNSILNDNFDCKVSSVLNKNAKQYGKMYMFDKQEDTCWCSENSSPQWITIQWKSPVDVSSFSIQFQGGFVGQNCEITIITSDDNKSAEPFYPEDNNALQVFSLKRTYNGAKQVTLRFNTSSDFFGRVIVYKLDFFT